MKALDQYIVLVLFVLLLKRVHFTLYLQAMCRCNRGCKSTETELKEKLESSKEKQPKFQTRFHNMLIQILPSPSEN